MRIRIVRAAEGLGVLWIREQRLAIAYEDSVAGFARGGAAALRVAREPSGRAEIVALHSVWIGLAFWGDARPTGCAAAVLATGALALARVALSVTTPDEWPQASRSSAPTVIAPGLTARAPRLPASSLRLPTCAQARASGARFAS